MLMSAYAHASFTVAWDHNDPMPDAYALYDRIGPTGVYDYENPFWEGIANTHTETGLLPPLPGINPCENLTAAYDRMAGTVLVEWNQPAPLKNEHTVYMVVRAQIGTRGQPDFEDSADSEEVSVLQSNTNSATRWEVFYSETSGGPYTSLGSIPADQTAQLTDPLTAVAVGERKTIYFTVVTFGQGTTYSTNSPETSVVIDRRTVTPPQNINVQAVVPVQ